MIVCSYGIKPCKNENATNHLTADLMCVSLDDGQIAKAAMTQSKVCIKACNNSDVNTISSKVIVVADEKDSNPLKSFAIGYHVKKVAIQGFNFVMRMCEYVCVCPKVF